jgi:hypothetical protein
VDKVSGTFLEKDVVLLLKDITGQIEPMAAKEREPLIQSGVHYSEMLPREYIPSDEYIRMYQLALAKFAPITANAIAVVAEKIWAAKQGRVVLVSLARSGTPIGILVKRYLDKKYQVQTPHYTISIIRGRGIDENAIRFIINRHPPTEVQFIDGWTGKGAILRELTQAMAKYQTLCPDLAVVADPAGLTKCYGTKEDFLIASSCLNATVCGLMSRTVLRQDLIGSNDFHGVVFYHEFAPEDRTYDFIHKIESHFSDQPSGKQREIAANSIDAWTEVLKIAKEFDVPDINFIKPSVGEATRVLLRRIPDVLLVKNKSHPAISHLLTLAQEKGVLIQEYPLENYNACGIIKSVGADV